MANMTQNTIQASTQEHLSINDVIDNIIINKDGSCSLAIQVTAINFNLLSEREQDAIIYAYAGLLNSLTFSIQIIIRSQIKDVTDYVRLVRKQEGKQKNPLLLNYLVKYRQFVENLVRENRVLDKKFFIIVPFTTTELGVIKSPGVSKKSSQLPYSKTYILEKAKMNLIPKRDHLFRQFGRLGLQAKQLNTQQLLELVHNIYNQESFGAKLSKPQTYSSPIVQAAISKPTQHQKTTLTQATKNIPNNQPNQAQPTKTQTNSANFNYAS
jgi:hypothetical protein